MKVQPENLAAARQMLAVAVAAMTEEVALVDRHGDQWDRNPDGTYSLSLEDGDWAQSWTREAVVREYGPVKPVMLAKAEAAR